MVKEKIQQAAAHPGSIWATVGAIAVAMITAWSDSGQVREHLADFTYKTEESHYAAIVDLRKKVDFLHGRLVEVEMSVKAVPTTPPVLIRPPGPTQEPPPVAEVDAGPTDEPDAGEALDEDVQGPEAASETPSPSMYQQLEWAPINRPAQQQRSK